MAGGHASPANQKPEDKAKDVAQPIFVRLSDGGVREGRRPGARDVNGSPLRKFLECRENLGT